MKKQKKGRVEIDYLKLFKNSLAVSFSLFLFGAQNSYATTITGAGDAFNTQVSKNDNKYNITGGIIKGTTGFHHFNDFILSAGDIANLVFNANATKYINMVENQVQIHGIFNALKGGNGGNVVFVSPMGMIVGATGIMNVGSLQLITPNTTDFNRVVAMRNSITESAVNKLKSDSIESETKIEGKIFAQNGINIADGTKISIGRNADIVSGFKASGFAKTSVLSPDGTVNLDGIVNADGVIDSNYLSGSSGSIKLVAKDISSTVPVKGGLIQSTGSVSLNTPGATGTKIINGAKIQAGGNVTIGNLNTAKPTESTGTVTLINEINTNGKVTVSGDTINLNKGANITASGNNGSVELNAGGTRLSLKSDITAGSNININAKATLDQDSDSVIKSTNNGNILIDAVNLTQNDGAVIRNEGTGNIIINAPGIDELYLVEARNGNVEIKADSLTLKNTVSASGNIDIGTYTIKQASGDFTALDSGGYTKISANGDIGTSSQSINIASTGEVILDGGDSYGRAYVNGSGDKNLNISSANKLTGLTASSNNELQISGTIETREDINLSAKKGITQDQNTTLTSYTGNVSFHNTDSGNISTGNVISETGNITVKNDAVSGNVNLVNNLTGGGFIDISSKGNVTQTGNITAAKANPATNTGVNITADGTASLGKIDTPQNIKVNGGNVVLNKSVTSNNGQIDITAQNGITQTTSEQTLEAAKDINLSTTNGDIGTDSQRVIARTAQNIHAASTLGSVNIEGKNTNIDLANIQAGKNYNLGTTGTGSILISGDFDNANGGIKLDTDKALNIEHNITAAGDISLISKNGITQTDGTIIESGRGAAESGNIEITNFGTNGITLTDVTANKGGIRIENVIDSSGDVLLGTLNAAGGDIYAVNNAVNGSININSTVTTDGDIQLNANKNIIQTAVDEIALTSGGDIDLIARNGSAGTAAKAITLNAAGIVNTTSATDVYLESPGADLKTGVINAGNNVSLKTTNNASGSNKNIILSNLITGKNVDINSAGSILQETNLPQDKAINADGDLSLTAQTGSIGDSTGTTLKAVVFTSTGNLSANAAQGSVALHGINTSIDTQTVNAGKNLDLITSGTGNITVSNEQNVTGHINLDSAENIILNKKIAATEDVTLIAKKDVTQAADLTGTALKSNKNINITAANAGTADKSIIVDAQEAVNVGTADLHAGNIYLEDNTDDFTIGQMYADNNLSLKAYGNITGHGSLASVDPSIISSGNVTLYSETGGIGVLSPGAGADPGNRIPLRTDISGENSSLNVLKSKYVNLQNLNTDLAVGNVTSEGNVMLTSSKGMELKGLIDANDVHLSAENSIIQNKNVTTKTINAKGNLSITSAAGDVGATGNTGSAILFGIGSGGSLSAEAQQGSVYLNGVDTNIDTGSIKALNDIDLTTTNSGNITISDNLTAKGHIKLDSAEALNLDKNLTADDYIDLKARGGDVTLNAVMDSKTDINVTASGNIKQKADNNSTVLNAGKDINLTASGSIGDVSKSILLNSDGKVSAKAGTAGAVPVPGGIYLSSVDKTLTTGKITAQSQGDVKIDTLAANKDIKLTDKISGKNVDINATGSILQALESAELDRSIEAAGNLKLTAQTGNIGQTNNAVDFTTGGGLEASAANGSVVLNGIDTDINTNSITAKNDIDLSTENSGKITVSNNITTNDGYIRLSSAENLELNHDLSAGKYITLDANGGIIQADGKTVTSGTNSSTAAGQGNITITNSKGGEIVIKNASANKGNINIKNNALAAGQTTVNGNVTTGTLTAHDGSVSVYNNILGKDIILDSVITAGTDIDLSADGKIVQSDTNTGLTLNAVRNIKLKSANSDLGANGKYLKLNAGGTVGADGDNVYLESTNKDLNISGINKDKETANGTIDVKTTGTGDIKISGLIKGGNVGINAAQGITQDSALAKAIDAAVDLNLTANNGSIGAQNPADGGALKFSTGGNLSANATQAVVLHGIDTDITTSSISAGTDIDLKTTVDKDPSKGNIIVNNVLNAANGYISLDSAKGLDIKQNITASENITLAAKEGSIALNSAIQAGTYLEIDANGNIIQRGGSLHANGQNTDGTGIDITSQGGEITLTNAAADNGAIKVTANEVTKNGVVSSGNINAGGLTSSGGKIYLTNNGENKEVVLTGLINSGANDIEITSKGNISQNTLDTTLSTSANVILDAADNLGSASNSILVNADGTVKADGNNVYLGSKDKNLNIAGINSAKTSANGIVNLKTDTGNIHLTGLVKGGNVTMDSATSITQASGLAKSVDGENISLTTRGGGIGADGNAIDLSAAGKVDADSAGDVYLNSPEGDLTTGTITALNHKVDINSAKALELDGLISAKNVILKAVNDITQNAALATEKSIQADTINLTSTTGNIGTPAQGGNNANAIDFSGSIEAHANNGSVVLNGVNTSISTGSISAKDNIDLSTTGAGSSITVASDLTAGGYIRLNSEEGLVLDRNLNAADYISLGAQKDILLNSLITAGTYIDINALGQITQAESNNNIVLNAGTNIALNAGRDIGLSAKSVLLNANGTINAQGQNIYLDSPNKDLNISSVTSNGGGTIKLSTSGGNGNINLKGLVKGGNVTVNSEKGIKQDSALNKSIEAGNSLVLNAKDGDIGEAAQGAAPANAVDFSAGSVEAHADRGSVVLNGENTNINTSDITAMNNIDLTTTNSGDITVSSALQTTNGYINLNAADNLILNQDVTSDSSYVSLGAQNGNITLNSIVRAATDLNLDANGNIIQQINDAALNAGNNINITATGNAGASDKSLLVNANNTVNVTSADNVYLEDTSGDFKIGSVNADRYVKLTANQNLLQDAAGTGVKAGANADLTSKNANIGSASQAVKTNVTGLVNASALNGSAYLSSAGDINIGNITAKNNANVNSADGININGLIKSNEINLTAQNDITQTNDGKTIEAAGGNINLTSNAGNIGTPDGNAIGFSLQGAGVINANAQNNGSVVLKGIDSNINTSTIKAKNDIDLTTTGSGNITVSNDLNAGGYIKLDSANALTIERNLTADDYIALDAKGGDITLKSALKAGTDITLDSTGSVIQDYNGIALSAQGNIDINAATDIGSDTNAVTLNSGGIVTADGNNVYLTSPNANLTTGSIIAKGANGIAKINTTGSGSITANENITGSRVAINSAENVTVKKDVTAQNGLEINAEKGITQNIGSTISTQNGNFDISSNNGNLDLGGTVANTNGAVRITNNSTGSHTLNVNNINAGTDFDIIHKGNGLLSVTGNLNNNGTSVIEAQNTGADSGISISGNINNKKDLTIESQGQEGISLSGSINNALADGSKITVNNHNGGLHVTSHEILNGMTNGSDNSVSFTNNGSGGLNINSDITNRGEMSFINNDGTMDISGVLNAELGSKNTFTNGSDNNFTINSQITNKGNELTFSNTGAGNLILGENAFITVYSVIDNGTIYTGTLNLLNSGTAGNITIDGRISGLSIDGTPVGHINIENTANGADSAILISSTADIDAKNNTVNITNNGTGSITVGESVDIKSDSTVSLVNNGNTGMSFGGNAEISGSSVNIDNNSAAGGIKFEDGYTISSASDLNISNSGNDGLTFGENTNLAGGSVKIENTGANGITAGGNFSAVSTGTLDINNTSGSIAIGDNAVLKSDSDLSILQNSNGGISFGRNAALSSNSDMNLLNQGAGGIVFNNEANLASKGKLNIKNTGGNGIILGTNSNVTADSDLTLDNAGNAGINIEESTNVTSKNKLTINNTGSGGIIVNGTAKGKDVYVSTKDSNVSIAHNKNNGNLIAENYMSVNVENGSLVNTSTDPANADNQGLVAGAGMDLNVTGGSIGVLDSTLNSIIQNGFVLDHNNSIHVNAGGVLNAHSDNDLNIRSINKNLNIGSLTAKDALLSSINGAISASTAATDNLYLLAKGNNSSINIEHLNNTGKLTSESDLNTTVSSDSALNIDSMLSKNGSININSEGNVYINEIAGAENITVNVEDERLTITNLGRVDRDKTVIPKTVNLTVKDAKRPHSGTDYRPGMSYDDINTVEPNSKLDIYHGYVKDKVTLKADTITAQAYDISNGAASGQKRVDANGNAATGFHNANTNGKLLEFDIQGANYAQADVGSDPNNAFYAPDPDDKHALNVHLTIGDSVNGAKFGANFKKLYSDYAFIDTVGSDPAAFSEIVLESGIIGEKAVFRNNKLRLDIDNTSISQNYPINKHYNDTPDVAVNNPTSFNMKMYEEIEIDIKPAPPVNPDYVLKNDPNKIVRIPTIDSLTKEPKAQDDDNNAVNSDRSTALRNINWVIRNTDNDVIGASEQIKHPVVKSLVGISKKGILVTADTNPKTGIKEGDTLKIYMEQEETSFNVEGKVSSVNGNLVEIGFTNIDKLTQNIMLFWCMESESLTENL